MNSDSPSDAKVPSPLDERYSRQVLYEHIGEDGQQKLLASRATLFGCGALGSMQAETLVRAGLGHLRIVDRDFLETSNLQRQVLFDERDVAENLPKAEAARRKLAAINSTVSVEAEVAHVHRGNIQRLAEGADVLLDGTDNFETRYLINDFAVSTGRPWVYGAVVGATGLCMPIIPSETPCLRCVFEQAPPPEMNPTADTVGILASAVRLVAAVQSVEAMKILTGRIEDVNRFLLSIDAWLGRFTQINVAAAREQSDCPCCRKRRFDYLEGRLGETSTTYCGRTAVQITPDSDRAVDFEGIADKLKAAATDPVRYNRFLLKATIGPHLLTLFPDGRAIIGGVSSVEQAQEFYARHIGDCGRR